MTPWRITSHARRRWAELASTPPGATSDTQLAEYVERTRERYADAETRSAAQRRRRDRKDATEAAARRR